MPERRAHTDAEIDAAIQALSDPERLEEAQRIVASRAPQLQRILDAALAVRSDAPYACKGGVCGTCRAKLLDGEVAMDRNFALEQDEIDAGFVLACQSRPVSDTVSLDFDQ